MTWSRYGQLLSFTDCSGYVTRYDHDRFGQMTAVHREEGLTYGSGYLARRHTAGGFHPRPPAPGNAAQLRPL